MYQLQEYKSFITLIITFPILHSHWLYVSSFGVERKSESNLWFRKKSELPLEVAFHTEQNKVSRAFYFLGMNHSSIPS